MLMDEEGLPPLFLPGGLFDAMRLDAIRRLLLQGGADPNPKDSDVATPLFVATGAKLVPGVLELLKGGRGPCAGERGRHNPTACRCSNRVARTGIDCPGGIARVGINVVDRLGLTPLLYYAAEGEDPVATSQTLCNASWRLERVMG